MDYYKTVVVLIDKPCGIVSSSRSASYNHFCYKYVNCTFLPRLNFRQQKFAVSLTYFERALDLMQKKYGHDSPPLISVFQSLGRVSSTVFDYEGLAVGF